MTDKVIEFPKHKVVRDVPGEVLEERQKRADQKMADAMVDEITGLIITELDNYYVNVEDKSFSKDLVLVVDALRAAVYRQFGFKHHLHEFIEKNIKLIDDADKMSKEEIQEKIEEVMKELMKTKEELDIEE
jgi:predicted P-loop ATPase/GTPase